MQENQDIDVCGNPMFERCLIEPEDLTRWQGIPLRLIEVMPHQVRAEITTERSGLVMIDAGVTQADFHFGSRAMSLEFTSGSIGLFTRGTELKQSSWRWRNARRIHIDLESPIPGLEHSCPSWLDGPQHTEIEFRDADLSSVLRMMVTEALNGSPNGQLYAQSLSLAVVTRLRMRSTAQSAHKRERGKLTNKQLAAVEEAARHELQNGATLATLAAVTGYSAAQFVRLFRNTTGQTPHQFVMALRMDAARALVMAGDMSLAMVADLTGFSNQGHMTTAFVRKYGAPPGELRRASKGGWAGSRKAEGLFTQVHKSLGREPRTAERERPAKKS